MTESLARPASALATGGAAGTVATVLLEEAELARRARTTLAAADVATVAGSVGTVLRVMDLDGEPLLPEPVGHRAGRRLTLVVAPRTDDGVWLVLDGVLRPAAAPAPEGALALSVESAWVGCPHGHGHARALDLAGYATAEPDQIRAAVPRLVEHTNTGHAPELRALAARRLGVPADVVAAAELVDLDGVGVTLRVLAVDGAHDVPLPFARPAVCARDLLALLRSVLTA